MINWSPAPPDTRWSGGTGKREGRGRGEEREREREREREEERGGEGGGGTERERDSILSYLEVTPVPTIAEAGLKAGSHGTRRAPASLLYLQSCHFAGL